MAYRAGQQEQIKRPEVDPNYRRLVSLSASGMLYEAEAWLQAGHSARQPEDCRDCPLLEATKMGFHSLVRMLLRYDCSAGQKQTALKRAVHDGAFEICKLLVEAGAKAGDLDTDDLPCYFRRDLIQLLVDHGLDLSKDRALANLLVDRRIKPLLGLYLRNKERFPDWEEQAAMALCEFVSLENLKWVSLMIWAGADPLKKVQDLCECSIDEGVDFRQSAAEIAITSRKPKIFTALKVKLDPALATDLLHGRYITPPMEILTILLAAGADLNRFTPSHGTVLHQALRSFAYKGHFPSWNENAREEVEMIAFLIRQGAKWRPPETPGSIADLRRSLYRQDAEAVVEAIRLMHAGNACPLDQLVELSRTPKMRGWIEKHDSRLALALGF